MTQESASSSQIAAPNITENDLASFHKTHFGIPSTEHFAIHFLGPVDAEEEEEEEEEDDELGYYDDGVKRTLTDEQIAIFRHSEIEAILRERRHEQEANEGLTPEDGERTDDAGEGEDEGEIEPEVELESVDRVQVKDSPKVKATSRRKNQKNGGKKSFFKQHIKPDLRKRTWDKVEQGMDSLDYGEERADAAADEGMASRRRKISYDDV